uniref:Uncharacterized protein n=1 Tax=Cucumis melo TaxID=3656 RepID=A0A9I9CXD8_CUCME
MEGGMCINHSKPLHVKVLLNYKSKGRDGFLLEYVDQLTVSGTGVLVGQGKAGWEKNDYDLKKRCTKLPMNLKLNFITNSIVKDIMSLDSKNYHINLISFGL